MRSMWDPCLGLLRGFMSLFGCQCRSNDCTGYPVRLGGGKTPELNRVNRNYHPRTGSTRNSAVSRKVLFRCLLLQMKLWMRRVTVLIPSGPLGVVLYLSTRLYDQVSVRADLKSLVPYLYGPFSSS